jgi:hypothetical protein
MLNFLFEGHTPVDAVIVSILHNEQWYGDDPPHWIISAGKRWQRPSQTAAQACEQREKTVKAMHRHGSMQSHIGLVARRIENCRPNHRCESGACPECQRALQRWMAANVHSATATLLMRSERKLVLVCK